MKSSDTIAGFSVIWSVAFSSVFLMKAGVFCFITEDFGEACKPNLLLKSMNKVFSFRRHFSLSKSYRWHSLLLIGAILSTLFVSSAFGQADYQNLAVVVNALTHLDLGITTSLSLIDLDEPNAKRAVADEILPLGNVQVIFSFMDISPTSPMSIATIS